MKKSIRPKYQYVLFILIVFLIMAKAGTRKRRSIWVLERDYWNARLMDYVQIGQVFQVPFNSTAFVQEYSEGLGLSPDPIQFISMSGSILTLGNHYLHLYRVLDLPCTDVYKPDGTYNGYCFQKPKRSLVYAQLMDSKFRFVKGTYKGLQYPTVYDIYTPDVDKYPGPEDGRGILDSYGNVIVSFNMALKDNNERRTQWTFNVTSGATRLMKLDEELGSIQKNWAPFFRNNDLLHIYSWTPIKAVNCTVKFQNCYFVPPNEQLPVQPSKEVGHFRSGSGLINYRGYYVTSTRSHRDCNGRVYRPHITILSPDLEPVYISEYLELKQLFLKPFWSFERMDDIPEGGYHTKIMTSLGLTPTLSGTDWIMEFSINDQKNFLVVLQGFQQFLDSVIYFHQQRIKENGFLVPHLIQRKEEVSVELCKLMERV